MNKKIRKKRGEYEKPVAIEGTLEDVLKLSFAPDKKKSKGAKKK
jgi:hypothetical protein